MIAVLVAVLQVAGPMRTIDRSVQSRIDRPAQVTARSETEWAALWSRHAGDRERPAVDFSTEMVVAVCLGSRPTAGFDVEIVGVRAAGDRLVVRYQVTRPRPGTVVAQVLTFPCHIVAVARHPQVEFERSE
jgi:hypothetical protein